MDAPPPYRRPFGDPDLEARIEFLSTSDGGRDRPVASGYRPNHDFGIPGELNDAQHEYPGREWVYPGETVSAQMWLLEPERQQRRLHAGFEFKVQEGPKVIAHGVVTNVINQTVRVDV